MLEPAKARTGAREHWETGWVVREGSAEGEAAIPREVTSLAIYNSEIISGRARD